MTSATAVARWRRLAPILAPRRSWPWSRPRASRAAARPARVAWPITPTPHPPLEPAQPGVDPISTIAWAFTPIFQAMFIVLIAVYQNLENVGVPGGIAIAIIVLTLVVRTIVIPLVPAAAWSRSAGCSCSSPRSRRSSGATRATR